jgi:hypothetical protein
MPSEKTYTTGGCYYERPVPPRKDITADTKIVNLQLDLEQALRLELALSECIRKINRHKDNSIVGKKAVVNLAVHLWDERIAVSEDRLPNAIKKKRDA